ncbi:hypothetical protein ACFW81_22370 [Streptomyces angustmyceticus]|uniref:hypothetical protein n=1 Tax=Streptomyces angustmyceticus TaxID=285578 RepID=UPI0021AECDA2|nr:hypothetical protein [Streptomyces angustmyceticus]
MKYVKSAVVVAGSVMALGVAAPAFAAPPGAPTMSLNGGLTDALSNKQLDGHEITPLVSTVKTAQGKISSTNPKKLLRGVSGATKKTSLLGGLPLK